MFDLSAAFQAGTVLLREGLEALLVVAALSAFLRRAGAHHAVRSVYLGAGLAVVASLAAAIAFELFLNGAHDDRFEAAVMAVAAVLMFYMSGWLLLKQDSGALLAQLKSDAERALSAGTSWSLASIAFLAVFREGAETMLFMHALAQQGGGWSSGLLTGLAVAAVALAVIFWMMQALVVRLPLRPVFLVTSAFLFVMGLRFVGGIAQELQEQAIVGYDEVPVIGDALSALGFNGTWQAFLPEAAIVVAAAVSLFALRFAQPKAETAARGA